MTFGVLPEDFGENSGFSGFSIASSSSILRDGREISQPPPRAEFLRPYALEAARVAQVLSMFAINGEFANPDFPIQWPHSRILSSRLSEAARQLKARIEEIYHARCRVKKHEEPRQLKVHELIQHIITFEQNMEIHAMYDCCRVFVENDGKNLPGEIVRRFIRSEGVIKKALEEYVAEEAAATEFREYRYSGGIEGDKNRERYLLLKKHGQERYTYRELRKIKFVDSKADDRAIRDAQRELTTALRNWKHATHECGKIRSEDAIFFRPISCGKE